MKSAMVATTPLRSGQDTSRMAELCIDFSVAPPSRRLSCVRFVRTGEGKMPSRQPATLLLQSLRDLPCGIGPGAAGQPRSRMRTVAARIKLLNGSLVARPIQQRSHREELVEREFAVKNMAAGKSVSIFEVFRRDDLVAQDLLRQRRRVLRNCLHD